MKKLLLLTVAMLVALFGFSCRSCYSCGGEEPLSYFVGNWTPVELATLMPSEIPSDAVVTFTKDSRISGSAGKNSFSAVFLPEKDHSISIDTLVTASVKGENSVLHYENTILRALRQSSSYERNKNSLVIYDPKGNRLMTLKKAD